MSLQSKGKSSKTVERPGINWRETSLEGSSLILSVVKEAATLAPIAELKNAACTASLIFKTAQMIKENRDKVAYERLGYDSNGLIAAIWRSFKKAEDPQEWLSAEMQDILEDLSRILENILSFICERLSKSKVIRVISSRDDGVKINEYREQLHYAMDKFKHQSHTNINNVLIRILKKNDQIIEQILHRNEEVKHALEIRARDAGDREIAEKSQEKWEISKLERLKQVEISRQTEDEQWYSYKLKKIDKEKKDRKSELERLRAACVLEEANRFKKAEEEEIAQLKRTLAAEEDNRRSNKIRAQSSEKKSPRQEDEVDEEEDEEWEGTFIAGEASEQEERPVRRSSKVRRNALGLPNRRPVALKDSTDDDEEDLQSLRSSRLRSAHRKLSSTSLPEGDLQSMGSAKIRMVRNLSKTSLRDQETEYEYTDEEDDYAPSPPRKSPKVKRKPQTSCTLPLPHISDDLTAQFQEYMRMWPGSPHWSGSNSRSGSPMYMPGMHSNPYFPTYCGSFPLPTGPYGYGVGMPGTVINAGIGNVTNTTMTNTTTPPFKRKRGHRNQHLSQPVGHKQEGITSGPKSG